MNGHQAMFLHCLASYGGEASLEQLSPQTSQKENSARQGCKRKGWATFNKGYWHLTDEGRRYLLHYASTDHVAGQHTR